ncbi:DUF2795 domain-containing protein [Lentzea albidocapillata]|uniref:DUF2795 domain-containing protein n=1 Tax=Lentzea albidocapillata TaxID=40571 RepID=A0A1W2C9S1_9PSEU|nr:DUF2795 domain-containing protein [Lentzea albidocapillata]SMC81910.1 Protein of unknown function [Lentzea albidocapillata]
METTEEDGETELRQVLDDLSYPADKVRIVICAEVHDLGTDLRRRLHHLPHRRYTSPSEVLDALSSGTTRP